MSSSREPPSGAVPGGMESMLVIQDVEGQLGTGKKPVEIFDVSVSLWGLQRVLCLQKAWQIQGCVSPPAASTGNCAKMRPGNSWESSEE